MLAIIMSSYHRPTEEFSGTYLDVKAAGSKGVVKIPTLFEVVELKRHMDMKVKDGVSFHFLLHCFAPKRLALGLR